MKFKAHNEDYRFHKEKDNDSKNCKNAKYCANAIRCVFEKCEDKRPKKK